MKTGGQVWNRRLPAVCPVVGCHICSSIPGVCLARRWQPHRTDVCSSRARWQTDRRASGNQGCVSILAPNVGVVVPRGTPAPTPPCRTSLALSPSLLVSQRDLFRSFFLFLSPCHPLFLEECVKGSDASDFLRWRDLLGDPSARPTSLKLEFPFLAVIILTFEKTPVPRKPQKRVHLCNVT